MPTIYQNSKTSVFSQRPAENRACKLNGVNMNPHYGIKPFKRILLLICFGIVTIFYGQAQNNDILKLTIAYKTGQSSSDSIIQFIESKLAIKIAYSNTNLKKSESINLIKESYPLHELLALIFNKQDLQYNSKVNKLYISGNPKSKPNLPDVTTIIEGYITDKNTKQALPFSTIRYKKYANGTIANENGVFKLFVPKNHLYDTLEISCLGYKLKSITPAHFSQNKTINIELEPDAIELSEITITPPDPKEILDKAIEKISVNYPQKPHYLNAYYRELIKKDSNFIKFCDAACEIYYDGYYGQNDPDRRMSRWEWHSYSNQFDFSGGVNYSYLHAKTPYKNDQTKIIQARASENLQTGLESDSLHSSFFLQASITGGPIGASRIDIIKLLPPFLNEKKYRQYSFKIKGITKYQNKKTFHFEFIPKKKARVIYQGDFYIDIESLAFVSFKYNRVIDTTNNHLPFENTLISDFNKAQSKKSGYKRITRRIYEWQHNIEIDYLPYNNCWYLSRIKHTNQLLNRGDVWDDIKFETSRELFINSIDTSDIKPFTKRETYRRSAYNSLYYYPYEYNPEFWKKYNSVVATGVFDAALSDLTKNKPLHLQFKDKVEQNPNLPAPIAPKRLHSTLIHKDTLHDNYYWMTDKNSEEVSKYLKREAEYTNNYFKKLKKLERDIYFEMVDRYEKNTISVPQKKDSFYYYTTYNDTMNYAYFYRKYDSINAQDQLIIDENERAKGYAYYAITSIMVSPNGQLMAFKENTSGGFENIVRFKNISKNKILSDSIVNIASIVWANNTTLYYTKMDSSFRSSQVYLYKIGQIKQMDTPIYEEKDSTFHISLYKSKDKNYVFIKSSSNNENETLFIKTNSTKTELKLIQKRQEGLFYDISVLNDTFYIYSNKGSNLFSIYTAKPDKSQLRNWSKLYDYQKKEEQLNNFALFKNFVALEESQNMEARIKVLDKTTGLTYTITPPKNYSSLTLGSNPKINSDTLEYWALSLTYPARLYRINMKSKEKRLVKTEKVLGEFDPKLYVSERIYATANDGTQIPITLIYNKKWKDKEYVKGKRKRTPRKLLIRGYGAYGIGLYPSFNSSDLSLLDRGYTIAYAHIRGGDEMGLNWYKQGRMLEKKNTFTDFKACMDKLIQQNYGKKGELIAYGGSAGGMLIGVLANEYPEYFKTLILNVPFTDVLNTMLDNSKPLTTGEFKEWGNPKRKKYYEYIKSYDPYQNIKKQDYPNMLFITYVNDANAPFYQAAKTLAKIREYKTDNNIQLLNCKPVGGHQGGSGRWEGLKDKAFTIAFIVNTCKP